MVLGGLLLGLVTAVAAVDGQQQTLAFLAICTGASSVYALAAWMVVTAPPSTRRGLWVCLALAVACRAVLLPTEPTISDDIWRYVWEGRVQRLGYNPYTSAPGDPALQHLHTEVTRRTAHKDLASMYPPSAQWIFRGIASVSESIVAFKVAFVACDLLVMALLWQWLARAGLSPWRVLLYAWNPLVIIEIAGSGHLDAPGVLLVMVSFVALDRRWTMLAAMAFVAAVEVKFVPIVLAPLFWRRVRVRDVVVACLFGIALGLPFLLDASGPSLGALPLYLRKWRFNGPIYSWVEHLVRGPALAAFPVGIGLGVAWLVRRRWQEPGAWAWPMGAALLAGPTVYPWYLLWLTPFLGAWETLPLLVWTQASLLTYFVWHVVASGGPWQLPAWVLVVEFGSVAAVGAVVAWQAYKRRAGA